MSNGRKCVKALIVSSVYGFLTKFERQNVELLKSMGIEIHYASNHTNVVYEDCEDIIDEYGIIYHDIPIKQQPLEISDNLKAIKLYEKKNYHKIIFRNKTYGYGASKI